MPSYTFRYIYALRGKLHFNLYHRDYRFEKESPLLGPGRSSRLYIAEEYVMPKELEEAVGTYLELLEKLLI